MTILAVVTYTGNEKHVRAAEEMMRSFDEIIEDAPVQIQRSAINLKASRPAKIADWWHYHMDCGYSQAINTIIQKEIIDPPFTKTVHVGTGKVTPPSGKPSNITGVLIMSHRITFEDHRWLIELLRERDGDVVLSPILRENDPPELSIDAFPLCQFVPVSVIKAIRKKFGFCLLHPDFSDRGWDEVEAACIKNLAVPFKLVRGSQVHVNEGLGPIDLGQFPSDLLRRIQNFKRSRRM